MARGNRTTRRGTGYTARRVVINAADGKALRTLLDTRHGYSAEEAIPALISGELATVLIAPEEQIHLLAWLDQTTGDVLLDAAIATLRHQLAQAWVCYDLTAMADDPEIRAALDLDEAP
jgi:hypothetical protein